MDPAATDIIVRTEVIRSGQPPVQIDYSMGKTPDGWKAYDVIVGGVSLVTNYRDEFTQQVQARRCRRTDQVARGEEWRRRGQVIDAPDAAAAQGGAFSGVDGGWAFGGALTLDDAAEVLRVVASACAAANGRRRLRRADARRFCGAGRDDGAEAARGSRRPHADADRHCRRRCARWRWSTASKISWWTPPNARRNACAGAARPIARRPAADRMTCNAVEVDRRRAPLRRTCRRSPASISRSRRASFSACSGRTAPARRR